MVVVIRQWRQQNDRLISLATDDINRFSVSPTDIIFFIHWSNERDNTPCEHKTSVQTSVSMVQVWYGIKRQIELFLIVVCMFF